MPGPFPGMDPYLEHPALWPGVHQGIITYAQAALNEQLPPGYVADVGERLYVVQPQRDIYPDVLVLQTPPRRTVAPAASVAAADPPIVVTVEPVEMREVFIEILAVADESHVVTVVEVLSPSNKVAGSPGRNLYLEKQREILQSPVHLLEIDLLRRGEHTVAVPVERLPESGRWDYCACLHRGGQGGRYEVWPISLRQRLPRLTVPLAGDEPDVVLDLQQVFERCYDAGAYSRRLDYHRPPHVGLGAEDAAWAEGMVRRQAGGARD